MPTLTQYRRALLEGIGGGGVYTTDAIGSTTTLVCAGAFKSSVLPADHLDNAWIYVALSTFPRQHRVAANGLAPSTGTITLAGALGAGVIADVPFELSALLPLIDQGSKTPGISLTQCVNLALRHMLVPDELTVAIPASAEVSLATLTWLDRVDRLRAVLEPSPVANGAVIDASWRFRPGEPLLTLDAELPKLRLTAPFGTATGNLTLQVLRPAETWLKVGGTWGEVAPGTGMTAESDEGKLDLPSVVIAGKVFAYQSLAQSRSGARRAEYQAKYEAALAEARALRYWDSSMDKLQPRPPAESGREAA